MSKPFNIFWFRRDLRLIDNHGLFKALSDDLPVVPLFIFDTAILDELKKNDPRITFIHEKIKNINEALRKYNSSLLVERGKPVEVFEKLIKKLPVKNVFTNSDYEPYAVQRDKEVAGFLYKNEIGFHAYKDQVIFEKDEVVKDDGDPYTVYTPYMRKWTGHFESTAIDHFASEKLMKGFINKTFPEIPSLKKLGFEKSTIPVPDPETGHKRIAEYAKKRDYPALDATTHVGVHLRFGTISIRELIKKANFGDRTYFKELVWREFFMQILHHFPDVVDQNFKSSYNTLSWINDEKTFEKWCNGQTGYPLVDAGMRQLNETAYMHNRARMVTAGFLTKHLLTDWRWGEAYFAEKLLDYELSSNNGNWQWAAGTGCDAAPYFRIFNPESQLKKFDPDRKYVKKWIPEIGSDKYPKPVVVHKEARERAIKAYKKALSD